MSQVHKRDVRKHGRRVRSRKRRTDENIENLKLKIVSLLNEYPGSNTPSVQNISVVENCAVTNTGPNANLNYFTSEIPLITSHSKSSRNNTQLVNKHSNLIYLTGAPKIASSKSLLPKNNSDLSEKDLEVLLQNFYKLESEEQQMLIGHLKKLEENKPEVVEKLKKFVRVSSPEPEKNQEIDTDTEFNDLDDLDDILDETVLFTDSESEDDCVIINVVETIIDLTEETPEESQTLEKDVVPEKISEMLEKSAENSKKNIKINLLSNRPNKVKMGNSLTSADMNNLNKDVIHIITEKKQRKIEKEFQKDTNKSKEKSTEYCPSSYENLILEKRKMSRLNNIKPNPHKIYSETNIELESPKNQEMQAKYFGYRNYKEMQQYLEMSGIYCPKNSYYSFSDNI